MNYDQPTRQCIDCTMASPTSHTVCVCAVRNWFSPHNKSLIRNNIRIVKMIEKVSLQSRVKLCDTWMVRSTHSARLCSKWSIKLLYYYNFSVISHFWVSLYFFHSKGWLQSSSSSSSSFIVIKSLHSVLLLSRHCVWSVMSEINKSIFISFSFFHWRAHSSDWINIGFNWVAQQLARFFPLLCVFWE